jgi:ubiquinone/menaquinone biosynthesis C-methylase UbiE
MEDRKAKEKQFHDDLRTDSPGQRWNDDLEELIKSDPMWVNMKYYAVERRSRQAVLDWYERHCPGKKVLDFCCGNGDDTFVIAKHRPVEIHGIDISDISVTNCQERAVEERVQDITKFHVMDAEAMEFDDGYFDIVTEYGALHHLNLEKAYSEIARVLDPGGVAICTETLGHNPAIMLYRRMTPKLRTEWEVEHILDRRRIHAARKYFDFVEVIGFYHLATIAAVPLRNSPVFEKVLGALEKVDDVLLRMPMLRWQAWQAVFLLLHPKKR